MYGIDLDEPGLLRARSWRWLRVRIQGLLMRDTRTTRFFALTNREEVDRGAEHR
ncbi:hypothetical protein [Amycolatopsis taiwanensis]|uniref:hypothetical protein n=1 Tax=Amycolatopsis taiwanensis TaxID=342230 RepID=UPI0004AD06B1|nr:hypothetical protein [Amycolatopsis taiwanensis]